MRRRAKLHFTKEEMQKIASLSLITVESTEAQEKKIYHIDISSKT